MSKWGKDWQNLPDEAKSAISERSQKEQLYFARMYKKADGATPDEKLQNLMHGRGKFTIIYPDIIEAAQLAYEARLAKIVENMGETRSCN